MIYCSQELLKLEQNQSLTKYGSAFNTFQIHFNTNLVNFHTAHQ